MKIPNCPFSVGQRAAFALQAALKANFYVDGQDSINDEKKEIEIDFLRTDVRIEAIISVENPTIKSWKMYRRGSYQVLSSSD